MAASRRSPPITLLRLPKRVRTVIVYGGSFDPPHFMHTIAPLSAMMRVAGSYGWVLYVPAAHSPHKPKGPVASDEHRLAMLNLALDIPGKRSVWTDEIDRARWLRARGVQRASYTVDTLRRLRKILPARVRLRLLIGSDQVRTFHTWKQPRAIIRLAEPLIIPREPFDKVSSVYSSLDPKFWTRAERAEWCTRMAPVYPMTAASTDVRAAIAGAPLRLSRWARREPLSLVVSSVARYIIAHNLYGFRPGKPLPPRPELLRGGPAGDEPKVKARFRNPAQATRMITRALQRACKYEESARRQTRRSARALRAR